MSPEDQKMVIIETCTLHGNRAATCLLDRLYQEHKSRDLEIWYEVDRELDSEFTYAIYNRAWCAHVWMKP